MGRDLKEKIGFSLIFLGVFIAAISLYLPWFTFSGTATSSFGEMPVNGEISAFGLGKVYSMQAKVTMWYSSEWHSAFSDAWFYKPIIFGILLSTPASIIAIRKRKFLALTLIGSIVILGTSIFALLYKPSVLVVSGNIFQCVTVALVHNPMIKAGFGVLSVLLASLLMLIGLFVGRSTK